MLGGYGARGREEREAETIVGDAKAVAAAGAFCIVVEGVLEPIATEVARRVAPPVIGIGASADCDGQVLVIDDMLGMFERTPRFVKRYDDLAARIGEAARIYARGGALAQLPDRRADLSAQTAPRALILGEVLGRPLRFSPQTLDEPAPASVHLGWGRGATAKGPPAKT